MPSNKENAVLPLSIPVKLPWSTAHILHVLFFGRIRTVCSRTVDCYGYLHTYKVEVPDSLREVLNTYLIIKRNLNSFLVRESYKKYIKTFLVAELRRDRLYDDNYLIISKRRCIFLLFTILFA